MECLSAEATTAKMIASRVDFPERRAQISPPPKKSPEKRLKRLWNGSRDSARTPIQWSGEKNAGFTDGTPWFYVNENYVDVNVEKQEADEDSVLNFYRKAIELRKNLSCVKNGNYKEYNKLSSSLYVYSREDEKQKILVICSYSERNTAFKAPKDFDIKSAELVLQNYPSADDSAIRPYETRVYLWKK